MSWSCVSWIALSASDDPNADPDNPAAAGEGSRHNYTAIGQINMRYDNNRNVLADGTREFRYNYRNQLRRVWRKSDGDVDGKLAEYREDALGRRVMARTWWELARRVYFDTRFELDVDLDHDNDGTKMLIVDGGIRSGNAAAPGMVDQQASWPSRIDRAKHPQSLAACGCQRQQELDEHASSNVVRYQAFSGGLCDPRSPSFRDSDSSRRDLQSPLHWPNASDVAQRCRTILAG